MTHRAAPGPVQHGLSREKLALSGGPAFLDFTVLDQPRNPRIELDVVAVDLLSKSALRDTGVLINGVKHPVPELVRLRDFGGRRVLPPSWACWCMVTVVTQAPATLRKGIYEPDSDRTAAGQLGQLILPTRRLGSIGIPLLDASVFGDDAVSAHLQGRISPQYQPFRPEYSAHQLGPRGRDLDSPAWFWAIVVRGLLRRSSTSPIHSMTPHGAMRAQPRRSQATRRTLCCKT